MATLADFRLEQRPDWCPACGDFAVLSALQQAVVRCGLEPQNVVAVSGIGCSGKISQHFGAYGFHALHGRSIPVAVGVKMGNRDLTVIAAGGDGDGFGIGLGHFLHAVRRNIDITYIVMDNHMYALTTGQSSPTSPKGMKTKTSPYGTAEYPTRPLALALANGCTYVAQGFSGNAKHLSELIEKGIKHRGFSLINVFSPCVTFNKINTYDWYRSSIYNVDADPNYDRTDRVGAFKTYMEKDPLIGVLFQEERPTYEEDLYGLAEEGLSKADITLKRELFDELLDTFR